MNMVLIGMRGSGKSSVGRMLGKKMNKAFIETDALIAQAGGKPVRTIITEHGWDFFRKIECEVVRNLDHKDNSIIATGGGVVLNEKNVTILKKKGYFIWLKARAETLIARIGNDPNRPSLTGKPLDDDIKETLEARDKLYREAADVAIDTDHRLPEDIVEVIMTLIEAPKKKGETTL